MISSSKNQLATLFDLLMQWAAHIKPSGPNTTARHRPSGYQAALWAIILVLSCFLSLRNYGAWQTGAYVDDAEYTVLAQSLAHSGVFGLVNMPGQPGSTRYPFGYPLLLAPIAAFFPDNLDALKIPSLIATILNAGLLFWGWRWISSGLSYWWGLAVSVLYVTSPLIIGQTRMVMSEPIFVSFCLASIILIERTRSKPQGFLGLFMTSICLLFAAFTRTVGWILVILVVVYVLWVRGRSAWRELAVILGGIAVLLGALVAATPLTAGDIWPSIYVSQLSSPLDPVTGSQGGTIVTRVVSGIESYFGYDIRDTVLPIGGGDQERAVALRLGMPFLPVLFGFTLVGCIAIGYLRWIYIDGISISLLWSACYLLIMIVWPWRGPRFLYPIQPQLNLGLLLGVATFLSMIGSRLQNANVTRSRPVVALVVIGLAFLNIYKNIPLDNSRNHVGDLQARSSWLRRNSEVSAVIMTEQPQTDYLYSGRRTVPDTGFGSISELQSYLVAKKVDYILIAPEVVWQSQYSPLYSPESSRLLGMLDTLASDGRGR